MKSLIRDAMLQADGGPSAKTAPPTAAPAKGGNAAQADAELSALIDSTATKIKVIGCGGGGSNTVSRLAASDVSGVDLFAINTDAQHLLMTKAPNKILIGKRLTRGLGAGSLPQVGEEAARETETQIREAISGADVLFLTCGLGGGTGTGSAPVVADIARELGILTIGVCTLPFKVEGPIRMENAEAGLARLRDTADTTIVIPNDKLLEVAPRLPLNAAFRVADEILVRSIKGITEMVTKVGLVNLDFADLKTILKRGGVAMIGLGESDSDHRAKDAIHEALNSPLLDVDISEASGALVNVVGGEDMTIGEAEGVVEELYQRINPDARIIWGAGVDPTLERSVRCMVVLTGVKSNQILGPAVRSVAAPEGHGGKRVGGVDFVI
ncbi:MAG: cell division protein FtsZ [Methanobacteriota archaeon]